MPRQPEAFATMRVGDVRRALRHWIEECEPNDSRRVEKGVLSMVMTLTPADREVVHRVSQPRDPRTSWGRWVVGLLRGGHGITVAWQLHAIARGLLGAPDDLPISESEFDPENGARGFAAIDDQWKVERWAMRDEPVVEPPPEGESIARIGEALKELGRG